MTSPADILREKDKFLNNTDLVKALVDRLGISSRQVQRKIQKSVRKKEIKKIPLPDRSVLYGLPSWPIKIPEDMQQKLRETPRVSFKITQRIKGNPFQKRRFPSVGFNLISKSRFPIKVRIEALPKLGNKKLALIQDRKRYYSGETICGPYDYDEGFENGNFTVPPECVDSDEELTIVIRVTIIDPFGQEHKKVKGWTYIRGENEWFYEPKDFSYLFDEP
jgi:hypothetical protein